MLHSQFLSEAGESGLNFKEFRVVLAMYGAHFVKKCAQAHRFLAGEFVVSALDVRD
jgi:hypothetical protein